MEPFVPASSHLTRSQLLRPRQFCRRGGKLVCALLSSPAGDWRRGLCPCRERPHRRAPQPRDDLPALHWITSSAAASSVSGTRIAPHYPRMLHPRMLRCTVDDRFGSASSLRRRERHVRTSPDRCRMLALPSSALLANSGLGIVLATDAIWRGLTDPYVLSSLR